MIDGVVLSFGASSGTGRRNPTSPGSAGSEFAVETGLTVEQAKRLLAVADRGSLRGKRDHAMIEMLIGYGLRRGELLALRGDSIQSREEHSVIADSGASLGTSVLFQSHHG
jgi:site-specific recombinase XerD